MENEMAAIDAHMGGITEDSSLSSDSSAKDSNASLQGASRRRRQSAKSPAPAPQAADRKVSKPQFAKSQIAKPQIPWREVPLEQIVPRSAQPRKTLEYNAFAELVESVQTRGVLQPILVRQITSSDPDGLHGTYSESDATRYEIIAGERRWRASREAGLTHVPVLVQTFDDDDVLEIALIENLQREDLTPLETAAALVQMQEQGYSIRKLGIRLGKNKGWVEEHLLLARLPADLQAMVSGRPDTLTHARELTQVTNEPLRASLIGSVLDAGQPLSLAALRKQIREAEDRACEQEEMAADQANRELANLELANREPADLEASLAFDDVAAAGAGGAGPERQDLGNDGAEAAYVGEATIALLTQDNVEHDGAALSHCPVPADLETGHSVLIEHSIPMAGPVPQQEAVLMGLIALILDLGRMDRPAQPEALAQMAQYLREAQTAMAATLERWGV